MTAGNITATATHGLVARDAVDNLSLEDREDIILGDVIWRKLVSAIIKNLTRKACQQITISWGSSHGLQRITETRRFESDPDISDGKSKDRSLSTRGLWSGVSSAEGGSMASILYGPVQLSESFTFSTASSVSLGAPWRMMATQSYTETQVPRVIWGAQEEHQTTPNS